MIRPAAFICCSATVARLMPSWPVPIPAVALPSDVMIGMTFLASIPTEMSDWAAVCSSGNSNGVVAANCLRSFRNDAAFSPDPSIVVNAICACCIPIAVFTPVATAAVATPPKATVAAFATAPAFDANPDANPDPVRSPARRAAASDPRKPACIP